MRFSVRRRGRDLNPRRTQKPETVFETVANLPICRVFVLVRQSVRQRSGEPRRCARLPEQRR